jgi:hypothetical protein
VYALAAVQAGAQLSTTPLEYPRSCLASAHGAEVQPAYPASARDAALRAELESLMLDCCRPGWDGYGAEAVSIDAYHAAGRFVRSLPVGIPQPEIAADPDGCVTFEWRKSPRRTLLVSVRPGYAVDYAALIGTAKAHGSEPFFGELPETLKALIRRVVAA